MPIERPPSKRPSRILPIVAILVILVGFGMRFLGRDDTPPPSPTPADTAETHTVTAEAPTEIEQPTRRRDPSLPFNPRATEIRRAEEPDAPVDDANPYAGPWAVIATDGTVEEEIGRAQLTPEGPDGIRLSGDFWLGDRLSLLRIVGDSVEADYAREDQGESGHFTGGFNGEKTELTLSGTLHYHNSEPEYSEDFTIRFVKVSEEQLQREARLAEYRNHARGILRGIQEFAKDNGTIPPRSLSELVPSYIDDSSNVESTADRDIAYNPNGTLGPPEDLPDGAGTELSGPELIAHERASAVGWNGILFSPIPVLTISYPADEYVVYAEGWHETTVDDLRSDDRPIDPAALVERCQNNLKQLGLVGKMFENEHVEGRWPAGPHHLYPEYFPDPGIMTCPSVERGTISYAYIFPAANEAELREVFREVTGEEPERVPSKSQIPMMYEMHLCATGDASNVLFLDGHVEFLTPGEFAERVEPFLRVRIH